MNEEIWPSLPLAEWEDTCATLHMWSQIVGKIALARTPLVNHWWNVTLQIGSRGLSTRRMQEGTRAFQMELDFIDHQLIIRCDNGTVARIDLYARPVSDFYREVMESLERLDLDVSIWPVPVEVPDPVPFASDNQHSSYDPEYANRFWRLLVQSARVFEQFRSRFVGKSSPVHFFWGSFDLAVTRFSGRAAPEKEGADLITREAYSHEVISAGWWPGTKGVSDAAFYAYAAPVPEGFGAAIVHPDSAFYDTKMGEFLLPYEEVRRSPSPDQTLLEFLQSTYEAGATLGRWDRAALERE
jgi:hypothetical protein